VKSRISPAPSLLIIDEVGYLTLETAHASLLFQAICERYEKQQAIVLTSNKAFADWSQVFAGDAIMASAALDRLLHRSTVIKYPRRQLPTQRKTPSQNHCPTQGKNKKLNAAARMRAAIAEHILPKGGQF
jgi:IstB-like ATP binding protein